jgi:hypothetical protein
MRSKDLGKHELPRKPTRNDEKPNPKSQKSKCGSWILILSTQSITIRLILKNLAGEQFKIKPGKIAMKMMHVRTVYRAQAHTSIVNVYKPPPVCQSGTNGGRALLTPSPKIYLGLSCFSNGGHRFGPSGRFSTEGDNSRWAKVSRVCARS